MGTAAADDAGCKVRANGDDVDDNDDDDDDGAGGAESVFSGKRSSGPPSRQSEIWIFVSLVARLMSALRRVAMMEDSIVF